MSNNPKFSVILESNSGTYIFSLDCLLLPFDILVIFLLLKAGHVESCSMNWGKQALRVGFKLIWGGLGLC